MILTIDIGNTNTVVGFFEGENLLESVRIGSDRTKTNDEYEILLRSLFQLKQININNFEGGIISSVVPSLTGTIVSAAEKIISCKMLKVGPGVKTGLNILYDDPKEVGSDRIVNAVGAIKKYGYPLLILDFGTATTYCVIDRNKNYLGGIIAPGIGISADALFTKTAKLPRVELEAPSKFLNKNTADAMKSGIIFGKVGEVEYLVQHLKEETGIQEAKVIATGGIASIIMNSTDVIDTYDADLTLFGLREIYEKNIKNRR